MKVRHKAGARSSARATLQCVGVDVGSKFETLRPQQVAEVLKWADRAGFQVPKAEKASRARQYFARLQRHAVLPKD